MLSEVQMYDFNTTEQIQVQKLILNPKVQSNPSTSLKKHREFWCWFCIKNIYTYFLVANESIVF